MRRLVPLLVAGLIVAGCGDATSKVVRTTTTTQPYHAEYAALVSAHTGAFRFLHLGDVGAVADGHGGWLIFDRMGVRRLRHDGTIDQSWQLKDPLDISIDDLVLSGGRLFIEGRDNPAAKASKAYVEAYDARTRARIWKSAPFTPGGSVHSFAVGATRVYVGGDFSKVGATPQGWLAALDARSGRLLDFHAPPFEPYSDIEVMTVAGQRLYIGGSFSSVGRRRRSNLAALDARTGVLVPWTTPNADSTETWNVFVTHGQVLTYGKESFGSADERTGKPLSWPARMNGYAGGFAVAGSILYLGGGFPAVITSVDGHERNNLAAYDFSTHNFTSWGPNLAPEVDVGSIAPSGDEVLVTGVFSNTLG